jgi:ElaB/YqjD/DUF883 family membrane-anchored ribosome-binding protein
MQNASSSAANDASEKLAMARDHVIVGAADAVNSGIDAARAAKEKVGERFESLLDQGRDIVDDAIEKIRMRPWASVGIAFAAGYLYAKARGRH